MQLEQSLIYYTIEVKFYHTEPKTMHVFAESTRAAAELIQISFPPRSLKEIVIEDAS